MNENQKLSMLSVSFKINQEFESTWQELIKKNPQLDQDILTLTGSALKQAIQNMYIIGASNGIKHFRIENKV